MFLNGFEVAKIEATDRGYSHSPTIAKTVCAYLVPGDSLPDPFHNTENTSAVATPGIKVFLEFSGTYCRIEAPIFYEGLQYPCHHLRIIRVAPFVPDHRIKDPELTVNRPVRPTFHRFTQGVTHKGPQDRSKEPVQ